MALCAFALGLAYLPSKAVAGDRYYNNNSGWYGISQNSGYNNYRSNPWGNDTSRWYGPENRPVYSGNSISYSNNNDVGRWYGPENRPVYRGNSISYGNTYGGDYYYYQPRTTRVLIYIPSPPIPQPRYYYYRGSWWCR